MTAVVRRRMTFRLADPALEQALADLCALVRDAGGRALLVGGCVRDLALGLPAKDLDVEVYGVAPDRLLDRLAARFRLDLVGQVFGIVKLHGLPIDVAIPRRDTKAGRGHQGFKVSSDPGMTLEEAAARRDYTIDAMAYDLERGEILDCFGGLRDLEARRLRHTTEKFAEDPLRVLRGLQLAGRYNLTAAPETLEMARGLVAEFHSLPIERVWGEWQKWAARSSRPSAGLVFLQQCGWLAVFPELAALDGCPQDPAWHPEGDVWTHTRLVTDEAVRVAWRDGLDEDDRTVLVLAALCHDLGKPETTRIEGDRVRSPGHAARLEAGGRFLGRIGTPPRVGQRVRALCRYHLTHLDFGGSASSVRRLARALGEAGESIHMLARLVEADSSGRPPLPKGLPPTMAAIVEIARTLAAADAVPAPLLRGRHLLALGLKPGPRVGEILRAAYEAQLDGAFGTLDEARAWLLRRFPDDLAGEPGPDQE